MSLNIKRVSVLVCILILPYLLIACSDQAPLMPTATIQPTVTSTSQPPSPTNTTQPTRTSTATLFVPTATLTSTASPSDTPTLTMTASATIVPGAAATRPPGAALPVGAGSGVFVYMILQNGGGKDGCGEAVRVAAPIQRSKNTDKDIQAALDYLFSLKGKYYGNLYNPVAYSTLRAQDVEYNEGDGGLTVWLSGKYRPTGKDCDNTLVKAQIWSTAKQFGGISATSFYINGPNPFGDFVSNDK